MTEFVAPKIDLCKEMLEEMRKLEFQESSMYAMRNNRYFASVVGAEPYKQQPVLALAIQSFFLNSSQVVPSEIRLSLNLAQDHESWLTDLKLVLLPFLKANEAMFF